MRTRLSGKLKITLFALRESYIALLPFFILTSVETLFFKSAQFFFPHLNVDNVQATSDILKNIFPVLLVVSISYNIAKIHEIEKSISIVLSLTLYLFLISLSHDFQLYSIKLDVVATVFALIVPIVSTLFFSELLGLKRITLHHYPALGDNLARIYQSCLAFILCFVISLLFFIGLQKLFSVVYVFWDALSFDFSILNLILIRTVICQLIYFVGLHGENIYDVVIETGFLSQMIYPNLTAKAFFDLFCSFGGAGNSLALAISIYWIRKDKHSQAVTRIALPFLFFNISEILVYGLPLVFNRKLFYPFLITPIVNVFLAYGFLKLGLISFVGEQVPWTTPGLMSGYLATDGNKWAIGLQMFLITLDVAIYRAFVRGYLETQCTASIASALENRLGLASRIQVRERMNFQKAQTYIVNSHIEIHKIVNLIIENELIIYYQPKVKVIDLSCHHYEALLRLKMKDGKVVGPFFLECIEDAGLAPSIDLWVCEQVANDLRVWGDNKPKISINLHPDTLKDLDIIQQIIAQLKGMAVEFEIIERSFAFGAEIDKHIQMLRNHGFTLAIDDFGSGYSSLDCLHNRPVDVIKIDKSLIDIVDHEKGLKIYLGMVKLCQDLGFTLVAEGVETEEQMQVIRQANVEYVQGWYFAPALAFEQARQFQAANKECMFCLE